MTTNITIFILLAVIWFVSVISYWLTYDKTAKIIHIFVWIICAVFMVAVRLP